MYKFLSLLILSVLINQSAVRAQGFTITPTPADTLTLDSSLATCGAQAALIYTLHNTSATDSTFMWRLTYNAFPHAWTTGLCDPGLCLSPIPHTTRTFTITPGHTGTLMLELNPSDSGCGALQILVWSPADSAASATYLNYYSCLSCRPLAVAEVQAGTLHFYPNPVRSALKISFGQYLNNGVVEIYSLLGNKVFSQAIGSRDAEAELDLSSLENGLYIARISEGGKVIATRKFTRQD